MALWGGRFEGKSDPLFRRFNDSLRFDWRLVQQDLRGSIAWARALVGAKVLSAREADEIARALEEIGALAAKHPDAPPPGPDGAPATDEDVHSWVEARLIEKAGDLGRKLHTGRSRNDQVATDLRLWVREAAGQRLQEIQDVQRALFALAERERDTILPGYTHLQRAQPILFAHWCLAHDEAFNRDFFRFFDAYGPKGACPLGSGALAGTAYPIDRADLAKSLGFKRATRNSLDAVSDRDFVVEALAAASLCAVHLSRLAEDLIIYSTAEFGFIELDDAVTSGSSLMPQKKNPDALELIRAKCGRIIGAHTSLLITLKALPLAYNKDLQEDKEPLFDAMDALSMCLRMMAIALGGLKVNRSAARAAAAGGYSNATDLADHLVSRGVPFRDAHEQVGRAVRFAIEQGRPLEALTLDELRRFAPQAGPDVFKCLTLESCINRRDVPGGTAAARVAKALAEFKSSVKPRP